MIKFISLIILMFAGLNSAYSQGEYKTTNYYGIEYYSFYSYNSEESENMKDLFVDENEIRQQIEYKTGLKKLVTLDKETFYKEIMIQVGYNIYKNPYSEEQYYGNYELRVIRVLQIPNSNYITTPHVEIFSTSSSFVSNYPIRNAWKKEIKEIVTNLIDKFALDFKSSY